MKFKKIVINGANSYISTSLISKLLKQNFIVYALSTNSKKLQKKMKHKNLFIFSYQESNLIPNDIDIFIYFAWLNSDSNGRSSIVDQSKNLDFFIDQIGLLNKLNCKKIIFANSFYTKELKWLIENRKTNINPKYNYAIYKNLISQLLKINSKTQKIIDLYISNVYGPGELNMRFISYCINCWNKSIPITITNKELNFLYDFIYIDDAVELIYRIIIAQKNSSQYDICSNQPKFFKQYLADLVCVLDYKKIEYKKSQYSNPLLSLDDFNFEKNLEELNFRSRYSFKEGLSKIKKVTNNASKN